MEKWFKSSYTHDRDCVEVCVTGKILVRDSKLGEDSDILSFDNTDWNQFVKGLK